MQFFLATKIVLVLALTSAMTLFFLIFVPSFTLALKFTFLSINLKAALQKSNPAITPSCLAIILAFVCLFFILIKLVVISPPGSKSSSRAFLTTKIYIFLI